MIDMAKIGPSKWTRPERSFRMMLVRRSVAHRCHPCWGPDTRWTADFSLSLLDAEDGEFFTAVIDVHGTHWHGSRSAMHKMSNYWREKIRVNRARDRRKRRWARKNGVVYVVIWEQEVDGLSWASVQRRIADELLRTRPASS